MPYHDDNTNQSIDNTIQAIIQRIKASDEQAFKMLFFAWQPRIYRYVWLRVRNVEIAEDIVQDVFFRIWQKRATLQEKGNFTAFIFQIAHNLVVDWARKNSVQQKSHDTLFSNDCSTVATNENAELHELESVLSQAISDLPPAMQQAFVLHRFEHLRYQQIAAVMGISVKTVEKHMSAALKKLRNLLRKHGFS